MYAIFIFLHSLFRWLVLASLMSAIARAYMGIRNRSTFSKKDNAIRHWTATIAHLQLIFGIILYTKSELVKYFWKNTAMAFQQLDITFFAVFHAFMMFSAVVVVTVGSSLAKRRTNDQEKFKTMLIWFSIALLMIFVAIPWPFSPLASRPYFR